VFGPTSDEGSFTQARMKYSASRAANDLTLGGRNHSEPKSFSEFASWAVKTIHRIAFASDFS
jgi:hypothetical protein